MITREQVESMPDSERPEKIAITHADGHVVEFLGEAARAMYRWQLNGHELEEK